jgi:hypothetical protein
VTIPGTYVGPVKVAAFSLRRADPQPDLPAAVTVPGKEFVVAEHRDMRRPCRPDADRPMTDLGLSRIDGGMQLSDPACDVLVYGARRTARVRHERGARVRRDGPAETYRPAVATAH